MKHPGRVMGLGAIAIFIVLAFAWHLLTSHLATLRNAPSPPEPAMSVGGVTLTSDSIVLPDSTTVFPEGPAGALITQHCTACHSVEMIRNQPLLPPDKWQATVEKMRKIYHAQIDPAQDKAVVAALVDLQKPMAATK